MKKLFNAAMVLLLLFNILFLSSCQPDKYTAKNMTAHSAFSDISFNKEKIALLCRAKIYLMTSNFNGTALIGMGDEILFSEGFGYSDFENKYKNNADTVYGIASITKQFTAAAIMKLCEEGLLSVDDTLERFFPEYEQAKNLTVYDLLTMRSGLREYTDIAFGLLENPEKTAKKLKNEFPEIYPLLIGGLFTNADIDQRVLLPYIFSKHSKAVKGKSHYCNSNYILLGLIIEQVSNESYEDYIQREFFDPLGMENSNLNGRTTAKGYLNGTYIGGLNPDLLWAAGGICSNVTDVFKWDRALLSGKAVSKKSFEQMTAPTGDNDYGFGLVIKDNSIYHEGQMLYFAGINTINTKDDITVILLTNSPSNNHVAMYEKELLNIVQSVYGID